MRVCVCVQHVCEMKFETAEKDEKMQKVIHTNVHTHDIIGYFVANGQLSFY